MKPTLGQILIQEEKKEEVTNSGIIIPDSTVMDKPQRGTIVAIGKPKKDVEQEFKIGDKVIYKKWGGNEYIKDKVNYLFVSYEDILAIDD